MWVDFEKNIYTENDRLIVAVSWKQLYLTEAIKNNNILV